MKKNFFCNEKVKVCCFSHALYDSKQSFVFKKAAENIEVAFEAFVKKIK